ncbi:MAG: alkyl sulfatase dimerization domain-containing protein [Lachnospiraceae bacterium]
MSYIYNAEQKDATAYTSAYNKKLLEERNKEQLKIEEEDVANAKAHLILELTEEDLLDDEGNVIYDAKKYPIDHPGEFPDTVNPYLWQIKKDNAFAGVYKMAEGYYVVTGVEIAMVAFIRTKHGWIVEDCGNYVESARAAMKIAEKAIGEKIEGKIVAVIYSHSHLDHYAGVEAFITQNQVGTIEEGKIPVIAPAEYEQSLVDDNLYAGIAMSRRLHYQGGFFVQPGEKGTVSAGLNSSLGIRGRMSMILPNVEINEEKTLDIDGVALTFIPSPDTETRAHMCVYSHEHKVLYLGDNAMGTLHNTYTMRGARVRDAGFWGGLFYHLYVEFGEEVEAIFQGHGVAHFKLAHRPDNLKKFLLDNAVAYKFTSDQALLLANKGVKLNEVGNSIQIPPEIKDTWYTRDHYGNYTFNARGAVQRYLGFYDGNPVNLLPLPERELAAKFVEYMGSEEEVLKKAELDFEKGQYQWVATITNHLVSLNPKNEKARFLCADALEQLGYQTQTGLWRNAYLTGALELRHPGSTKQLNSNYMENKDVMPYVSASLILDYLAINFDGEKGLHLDENFVLKIENAEETYLVRLYKGTVLYAEIAETDVPKDITEIILSKPELYELATKQYKNSHQQPSADAQRILELIEETVVDTAKYGHFNIIEPVEFS